MMEISFLQAGSIEGQYFLKTGKSVAVSEQNILDCSRNDDNDGCKGGDMVPAYKYIHNNDGIDSDAAYPYKGIQNTCKYSASNNVTSVKGYGLIREGTKFRLI